MTMNKLESYISIIVIENKLDILYTVMPLCSNEYRMTLLYIGIPRNPNGLGC